VLAKAVRDMRCCLLLCAALAAAPDPEAADTAPLDVLLVSVGLHGHAVPLARLAHQLTERGHRATLATHSTKEAKRWAKDAGAEFVSLGVLEPSPQKKTTSINERAAGLMAAALRGFGDAKEEKKDAWDALDDADNEDEEGPLDARRLLLAARRARHHAAPRDHHSHQNDSEYDASLIPPSKTFAKASRKATALGALACLMNELYVPLTRPVYDALYEHLANGGKRPDVIVADVATLGARDAADAFDIPLVINAPSLLYGRAGGAPGAALSTGSSRSEKAQAALAPKLLALASSSALMTSNHVRRAVGLRIHSGPDELVPPALLRRPASVTDFPCAARAALPLDPPPPPRNGTCANDGIRGARPRELVLANTAPGFDPFARQPPPRVLATGRCAASFLLIRHRRNGRGDGMPSMQRPRRRRAVAWKSTRWAHTKLQRRPAPPRRHGGLQRHGAAGGARVGTTLARKCGKRRSRRRRRLVGTDAARRGLAGARPS
jgi:hypothetical protein